jgi:hypothetical protein
MMGTSPPRMKKLALCYQPALEGLFQMFCALTVTLLLTLTGATVGRPGSIETNVEVDPYE